MDIKCHECGAHINLDESLKNSLLDKEKEALKAQMLEAQEIELANQRAEYKKLLEAKSLALSENYQKEIEAVEAERSLIKDAELKVKKEKIALEDALKDAEYTAEKKSRELLKVKEQELLLQNKAMEDSIKARLELEANEKEKALKIQSQAEIQEKDLEIQRLIKEASDARQKLIHAKSSQELVGEAAELLLLQRLEKRFPFHEFEEIKKGQRGGDIIQKVKTNSGEYIGAIYYESKKTKNWSESWVAKFKNDIREKEAQIGILVSEVLPGNCTDDFFEKDGIWVTTPRYAHQLAVVLTNQLSAVYKAKLIKDSKNSLQGDVYDYVTGDEFIEKVKVVAEAHKTLNENLEKEKIAMQKLWANRKKEIDRSILTIVNIIGDLENLSAGNLKTIEDFQLPLE